MIVTHNGTTTTYAFTAGEARAMLAFAGKDATRQGLCGIALHDAGTYATATDGHRALALCPASVSGERTAPEASRVVPRATVERAVKAAGKGGTVAVTANCATFDVVAFDASGAAALAIEGQQNDAQAPAVYDAYASVLAEADGRAPCSRVAFNSRYLADVEACAAAYAVTSKHVGWGVALYPPHDDASPLRFDVADCGNPHDGPRMFGLIMPMRI